MEAPPNTPARPPFSISRYTITSADHGDRPRTLRELNALRALGAILNKRDWVTKWTTQPEVRTKWLVEIEDALVKATVSHVWSEWPNRSVLRTGFEWQDREHGDGSVERIQLDAGFDSMHRLLTAANMADEQEKRNEIERIVADVMYPPDNEVTHEKDEEDEDEKEEEGEDDSDDESEDEDFDEERYDASAIDTDFSRVFGDHESKNPFGQIAWYISMSFLREELRGVALADWTAEQIAQRARRIWSANNETVATHAMELILAVLRGDGPVTMQVVRSQFSQETRKNVLKLLQLHLTKIRVQMETTKQDISDVLDLVIEKNTHLPDGTAKAAQPRYLPGPAPKTWLSDDCIPAELKAKFLSEIAMLENVPDDKKDWHPNSNEQVLNLVHPSLYCGIAADPTRTRTRRAVGNVTPFVFNPVPTSGASGFGTGAITGDGAPVFGGFGAPLPIRFGNGGAVFQGFGVPPVAAVGGAPAFGGFGAAAHTVPATGNFSGGFGSGGRPAASAAPAQTPLPIYERTEMLAASAATTKYADAATHMRAIMFAPKSRVLQQKQTRNGDRFQWLPCEIDVAEVDGTARIRTYINNLHPEDHASLYESIGAIFTRFVPLFDQVVSSLDDALDREQSDAPRPSLRRLTSPPLCEYDSPRFTLKGKRCQVIVKIAEIVLTPEKPEYAGGSWHVEGTDAERIVATRLYYFGCENKTESRLSFRTIVCEPGYEQSDDVGVALAYGLKNDEALIQGRGSVTAMEDRCVVFPNILQHKVEPFRLEDPTKPGVRKILAFFLVDPTSDPIPSTAVVPPQQQDWVNRAQESAVTQLRVPDSVVGQIQAMAGDRMSLEQAQAFRLALMDERSSRLDDHNEDLAFSLCEH